MMERFSSCRAFWSQRASVPLGSGETDMRKIVGLAFLATMFMVSACNTVEGMGKDVSSAGDTVAGTADDARSEEHTSELQSLMRISSAVFCLKKKKQITVTERK